MSLNNVLPFWVYNARYEQSLAMQLGAFPDEWAAGTSKVLPKYVWNFHPATFESWITGWNKDRKSTVYRQLKI